METNKKITISADTSPLKLLRQEVVGLTSDVNNLGRVSPAANFDTKSQNKILEDLRKKIEVLEKRNIQNIVSPTNTAEQLRPTSNSRKKNEESDLQLELSEEQRTKHISRRNVEKDQNNLNESESTEIQDTTSIVRPKIEKGQDIERSLTIDLSNVEKLLEVGNTYLSEISNSFRQEAIPRDRTSIEEKIVESFENFSDSNVPRADESEKPSETPTKPLLPQPNEEKPERRPRERNENSNGGFRTPIDALTKDLLETTRAYATARNEYERNSRIVGVAGSAIGTGLGMAGMAVGGPIGAALGIGATAISGVTSIVSEKMSLEATAREGAERNVRPWSQTTGETINKSIRRGYEEDNDAASNLGLDVSEYMNKRANLLRSAGGKVLGKGLNDQESGVEESNSLLTVQRKYGLSEGSISQLQGSMRFAEKGEREGGSSTDSSSVIIRLFENTMRELKLPFTEIASTMEESLNTFNRTVQNVLDKTGSVDAGEIASSLAAIRANTGMEGKQLERVQKALTGQEVSKDPTTQALLIQSARNVYGGEMSYPEIMAKTEGIANDTDLQKEFVSNLQKYAGGNEPQMQSMMKSVFPGLSWSDVTSEKLKDPMSLLQKGISPEVAVGNEKDSRYKASAARVTIGDIERQNAETQNSRIGMPTHTQIEEIKESASKLLSKVGDIEKLIYKETLPDALINDKKGVNAVIEFAKQDPARAMAMHVITSPSQQIKLLYDLLKGLVK